MGKLARFIRFFCDDDTMTDTKEDLSQDTEDENADTDTGSEE